MQLRPGFGSLVYADPIPLELLISWDRCAVELERRADAQLICQDLQRRALQHWDTAVRSTVERALNQFKDCLTSIALLAATLTVPLEVFVADPQRQIAYEIKANAWRVANDAVCPELMAVAGSFSIAGDLFLHNALDRALDGGPLFLRRVQVDELFPSSMIVHQTASTSMAPARQSQDNPQNELLNWFRDEYVPGCDGRGIIPSRSEWERAAREKFPHAKNRRQLIRDYHRDHTPESWRTLGRRKLAKK